MIETPPAGSIDCGQSYAILERLTFARVAGGSARLWLPGFGLDSARLCPVVVPPSNKKTRNPSAFAGWFRVVRGCRIVERRKPRARSARRVRLEYTKPRLTVTTTGTEPGAGFDILGNDSNAQKRGAFPLVCLIRGNNGNRLGMI